MTADCQYYTEAAAERTRLTSMPLKVAIDEPLKALNFWSRVQGDVVLQRLESLVRSLGGDPNSDGSRTPKRAKLGPSLAETQTIDRDAGASTESERGQPILVEQDGQSYYVEMSVNR